MTTILMLVFLKIHVIEFQPAGKDRKIHKTQKMRIFCHLDLEPHLFLPTIGMFPASCSASLLATTMLLVHSLTEELQLLGQAVVILAGLGLQKITQKQ